MELADFQFKDPEGRVIPGDQLLGYNADVVVMIILFHERARELLGALERAGPDGRNFVIRRQLWMLLFQRDYTAPFEQVYDMDAIAHMRPDIREFLDGISDQPNRDFTYWKRYYEYLFRLDQRLGELEPSRFFGFVNGPQSFLNNGRHVVGPFAMARAQHDVTHNFIGRRYNDMSGGLGLYTDRNHPERYLYIFPAVFWIFFGLNPYRPTNKDENHPVSVYRIDLNGGSDVVPYNDAVASIGDRIRYERGTGDAFWRTPDGMFVFHVQHYTGDFISRYQITDNFPRLVSSCVVCEQKSDTKCAVCETVLCGKRCLNKHLCK